MGQSLRILLIEDSEEDAFLLVRELLRGGYEPLFERVASAEAMITALERQTWDVIISDYVIPGFGGLQALGLYHERKLDAPFIVVSGHIGEDIAVAAMRAGADDYLMKDRLARLGPAIARAMEKAEIRRAHRRSNDALSASEERFRQLAENIGAAFLMFERPTESSPGTISYVSPAYESIWGCLRERLFADPESWVKAICEEDRPRVQQALSRMAQGDFSEEFRVLRHHGELRWVHLRTFPVHNEAGQVYRVAALAEDTTARKQSEQQLRDTNAMLSESRAELEKRVQERTAELTEANSELKNQMTERKRLENELLEIAENERRRIGFDLHDDIGQKLMGVSLLLKALETNLGRKHSPEAKATRNVQSLLGEVINHTRDLANCFSSLDSNGDDLPKLLGQLIETVRRTFPITCKLVTAENLPALAQESALQLYKIAQESVNNAIRHGKAKRLKISLFRQGAELVLQIQNDGKPFPDNCQPSNRLGLRIMDYRARTMGGRLEIRPDISSGTIVTCAIPASPGPSPVVKGRKQPRQPAETVKPRTRKTRYIPARSPGKLPNPDPGWPIHAETHESTEKAR